MTKFLYYITFTVALFSIIINFLVLNKGLITSDEGWYLVLLKDLPSAGLSSQFHLLFQNLFNNNIYNIRLCNFLLHIFSSIIFSIGLFSFCYSNKSKKIHNFFLIFCFVLLGTFIKIPCMQTLSYISLNLITTKISIGLILLGLFAKRHNKIYCITSGFFLAFLIPIMITNLIIIPFFILLIFYYNNTPVKTLLSFLGGMFIFLFFYFSIFQSPQEYIKNFSNLTSQTIAKGTQDYGIFFLFSWINQTIFKYLLTIIIVAISIKHILKSCKKSTHYKMLYCIVFLCLLLWIRATDFIYSPNWIGLKSNLMWLSVFLFIFSDKNEKKDIVLFLFLCVATICLCFGSNVPFNIRNFEYFSLITPIFFFVLTKEDNLLYKVLFIITIISYFTKLCLNYYQGGNWAGQIYKEQNKDLSIIDRNQKLLVEDNIIKNSLFIKEICPNNATVFCHQNFWGYVAILNLKPIDYNFLYSKELLSEYITSKNNFYVILPKDTKLDNFTDSLSTYSNNEITIYKKWE